MPNNAKFLVKIDGDNAFLTIVGKASYLNCRSVGDFFTTVANKNCHTLFIDTAQCTGMDSTFLGMIAGVALKMRKYNASVTLQNLNDRNSQLVENLGLFKLVKVEQAQSDFSGETELETSNADSNAIIDAHENLIETDEANRAKFEDVLSFLQRENNQM